MPKTRLNRQRLEPLIRHSSDGWLFVAVSLLLFAFPLARGGNRLWAVSLFELCIFVLAIAWLFLYLRDRVHPPRVSDSLRWLFAVWVAWVGYIAVQIMPLPLPVLEAVSARSADLHTQAAVFLGQHEGFASISIVPSVTAAHLLESLAYFCLFALVWAMTRNRRRLRFMGLVLVASGLFQAVYGSLFLLSGAEQGLFLDKASTTRTANGTFVNRNHLAGYLEISAAVGIGLVLAQMGRTPMSTWRARLRYVVELLMSETIRLRVFVALMVVALVLTRSRTGNFAFVASLAVAGLVYILLRERRLLWKGMLLFATLFLIDLWILGSWFGLDRVVRRLQETRAAEEMRVAVLPSLVETFQAYWLTGSGLGSFYAAFPPFRAEGIDRFHDHAHHDYLQFLIEVGMLGSALIFTLVAMTYLHAVRLLRARRDRLVSGLAFAWLMAATAIGIHSFTDFNLQIPANAATLIVLMAMVWSCSPSGKHRVT